MAENVFRVKLKKDMTDTQRLVIKVEKLEENINELEANSQLQTVVMQHKLQFSETQERLKNDLHCHINTHKANEVKRNE